MWNMRGRLFAGAALALIVTISTSAQRRTAAPSPVGVDLARLEEIPPLVEQAIADKKLPGAVVLIGRGDRVVYQKAIGRRAIDPAPEPMTLDTIFDVASLTKVVATTTSVLKLLEQGRIRLNDRVSSYVPGFERYNKAGISIRHLLMHTSGLRPDLDLADEWSGYDRAIELAIEEVPTSPPGARPCSWTTPPRSSTPRARPAAPRAARSRTATSSATPPRSSR